MNDASVSNATTRALTPPATPSDRAAFTLPEVEPARHHRSSATAALLRRRRLRARTIPRVLQPRDMIEQILTATQLFVRAEPYFGAEPARELQLDLRHYADGILPRSIRSKHPDGA